MVAKRQEKEYQPWVVEQLAGYRHDRGLHRGRADDSQSSSNNPNETPGWPILNANRGPNGPTVCAMAAIPVVRVALRASGRLANRRRVGASSAARTRRAP